MNAAWRAVARQARAQGWRVEQGRKHFRWLAPSGAVVIGACSPSDRRTLANHLAAMRRAGFIDRGRQSGGGGGKAVTG